MGCRGPVPGAGSCNLCLEVQYRERCMNYSISQLANKFGLSRSTLLYYDSLGLLCPERRSGSNYRVYTSKDAERLQQICVLRGTGISLEEIKRIVGAKSSRTVEILQKRLEVINNEINVLRKQQKQIVEILGARELLKKTRVMNKETWVELMEAAGLDEAGMHIWHREFEATSPEAHQDFLESLGLNAQEIKDIRTWSRNGT